MAQGAWAKWQQTGGQWQGNSWKIRVIAEGGLSGPAPVSGAENALLFLVQGGPLSHGDARTCF